ncbi:MAG: agmatine deiminase family protein [Flavobacteriales bacterium]|nr:agmatine deiminase family protein [Flavobacteriales bacterium]
MILEGGGLIRNSKGVALVTNRIVTNNESIDIREIRRGFSESLRISKMISIPVAAFDVTGHIDGMVRFIGDDTLAAVSYGEGFKEEKDFLDRLSTNLQKRNTIIGHIVPKREGLYRFNSSYGNYISYMRIGKKIFLPQYGVEEDIDAKNDFGKFFEIIPISKGVDELAKLGETLNSITWLQY